MLKKLDHAQQWESQQRVHPGAAQRQDGGQGDGVINDNDDNYDNDDEGDGGPGLQEEHGPAGQHPGLGQWPSGVTTYMSVPNFILLTAQIIQDSSWKSFAKSQDQSKKKPFRF